MTLTTVPVSVVIPCFGHTEVIGRAVASVANQSVRPMELIVVNDGGGDEVVKALHMLQQVHGANWLSVVTLPANAGAGEARNAGWAAAKAEYIAFLDADDEWHPRKLEIQYAYMNAHPDVAVSGHRHRQERDQHSWDGYQLMEGGSDVSFARFILANRFVTPSAMLKRDLEVRFAAGQRHMEDFRLWLTVLARGGRVVKLDAELACTFKASFGEAGLSAEFVAMELGELRTYWVVCTERPILLPVILALVPYSLAKFLRRYVLLQLRSRKASRSASGR
jgi:glycosyltransferase involved in cell wall biosynthesis